MIRKELDVLSEYYQAELSYLRSAGNNFAMHFPKIAKRLDLTRMESSDPHIERLIESVAFLTGRLQKRIDDQFPEIAEALLNVIYKPLLLPIPSCTMIKFDIDNNLASKNSNAVLPKGSVLQTSSYSGETCSFTTAHDIFFYPIDIKKVCVVSADDIPHYYRNATYYIKLDLTCDTLSKYPSSLRFYIYGNALIKAKIFTEIFSETSRIIFLKGNSYNFLSSALPIGLEEKDSLFPYPPNAFSAFRLLQEYFAFADKFFGFDVEFKEEINLEGEFSLLIPIKHVISNEISTKNFSLSSVPAVNLFPKISEPLRLDYRQIGYRLIPDYRRYHSHEIYSISDMFYTNPDDNAEIRVHEFFECGLDVDNDGIFWTSKRVPSQTKDALGDDVILSFVDKNFDPTVPIDKIFYAQCLCTNRYMAEQIPAAGCLQTEASVPVSQIYCADRPTPQRPAILAGEIFWKLISILSLNSMSFSENGIQKIKMILQTFANLAASPSKNEVQALIGLQSTMSVRHFNEQSWKGFIRGTEVELTFNDDIVNLGLPLSMVLSKVLTLFTTINSFVDVVVKNTSHHGILRKWQHRLGIQNYL